MADHRRDDAAPHQVDRTPDGAQRSDRQRRVPALLDVAEKLCGGSLTPLLMNLVRAKPLTKGELQEFLQAASPEAPQYHVVSATGPDHDRLFECTVHHSGQELARGAGKSKKEAESEAALAALKKLRAEKATP